MTGDVPVARPLPPTPVVVPVSDPECLALAAEAMWAGGLVGLPTETVYGIAVLPRAETLAQVLRAKQRPHEKGIALMVDSIEQVAALAELPWSARALAERFWPGPLTLVLPQRAGTARLPEPLYGPTGDLGFRLPDHPVPRLLAARLGPMAVTSANVSGEPDSLTAAQLVEAIGEALALVVDDGPVRGGVPSTVVIVEGDEIRIARHGALPESELRAALAR
jgi:L-threonylcarbamoyladenylate synthase